MNSPFPAAARVLALLCALLLLTGCATVANPDPADPWEGYNRSMTRFNDALDDSIIKPVATAYRDVVPRPVRSGVSNFFGNLSDVRSFLNALAQGKPESALTSFWRVTINTTLGLGGLFDPATEMHLDRRREDFGQTLGHWGVPPGPYLVLPLLGPSTLRDTAALPADWYSHPLAHVNDKPVRYSLWGLSMVDLRSRLLGAGRVLDSGALDPYSFTRDAYLQKRRSDVYDGNPPDDDYQDEERYDLD